MTRKQWTRQPHSGQLRYHDYAKLRALHQARLRSSMAAQMSWKGPPFFTTNSISTMRQPPSTMNTMMISRTPSFQLQQHRLKSGWALLNQFAPVGELKRLERESNRLPYDAVAQNQFLSKLIIDHPEAVVKRVRNDRNRSVDGDTVMLYLQALQRTGKVQFLDVEDLVSRLLSSGVGLKADRLTKFRNEIAEKKLSKADQAQHFMQFLHGGGVGGVMAPAMGHPASVGGSGGNISAALAGGRGGDRNSPIYVQKAPPGPRELAGRFAVSVVMYIVFVSALGAFLDDKGFKGLGMSSNSKHVQEADPNARKVRFSDVMGVEEAKAELKEIVMYLKDPSKFTRLGGKLPRGLLLTGPPGTGKTLLARAIAGEADVPFYYSSGSQFEEVYVGLGAKRVRELFEAAKKKSPCIIFIDEIDAVGGARRLKDQSALKMTLNELLVQLDGFEENNGIIVIGATNFMESLDPALLRPGRFDKFVTVPLPDVGGRKAILEMYSKKTKLAGDVDLSVVARGTPGFSGADLYNLMNQAALKASVDGLNSITMSVLEYAKDKILMGAERKTAVITPKTAKCTAYHEAGHAVVAVLTEGALPVHKATIIPRGQALGMVSMLPEGDQTSQSLKEMVAMMDVSMGGRVAEELIFGSEEVTSGAMSDIQHATRVARHMVTKYGFSEEVGVVFHGGNSGEETASEQTRARIDMEVKRLTEGAYKRAKDLLIKHADAHQLLAETLLEYETLTGDEVRDLVIRRVKPDRPVIPSSNSKNNKSGSSGLLGSSKKKGRDSRITAAMSQKEDE